MMFDQVLFANDVRCFLAGPITNTALAVNVQTGQGALWSPAPTAGQYYVATLNDASTGNLTEIIHVTGVSGDTLTIVRAQEGTTGLNWAAGDLLGNFCTAGTMQKLGQSGAGSAFGVVSTASGLQGSASGGGKTAAWTANELIVETALGGTAWKGATLAFTFNGASTGVNGMDTGTLPGSTLDLCVYAIYNPTANTWATLGTNAAVNGFGPIYGGSHMPSGYTASALIWAGATDSSGNINAFQQFDTTIFLANTPALSGGTAVTPTAVTPIAALSRASKSVAGNMTAVGGGTMTLSGNAAGIGYQVTTTGVTCNFGPIPLLTAATLYYFMTSGSGSFAINSYKI